MKASEHEQTVGFYHGGLFPAYYTVLTSPQKDKTAVRGREGVTYPVL